MCAAKHLRKLNDVETPADTVRIFQIAYFAAVPKEEIATSGRILAANFFRNVFGESADRALSVFVALSAFGNVLSVIFSQGRRECFRFIQSYLPNNDKALTQVFHSGPRTWP